MKIAVLGWGSLIWNKGNLRLTTNWTDGGPILPIEFSRISDDGRLTLVIDDVMEPMCQLATPLVR